MIGSLCIRRVCTFQSQLGLCHANRSCIHNAIISHILVFGEKFILVIGRVGVCVVLVCLEDSLMDKSIFNTGPFFHEFRDGAWTFDFEFIH